MEFSAVNTLSVPNASLKTSLSAETLLVEQRVGSNRNIQPLAGVQSSQSDSLMDIRGNRTPVKTNFHHIGKELYFPVPGGRGLYTSTYILPIYNPLNITHNKTHVYVQGSAHIGWFKEMP